LGFSFFSSAFLLARRLLSSAFSGIHDVGGFPDRLQVFMTLFLSARFPLFFCLLTRLFDFFCVPVLLLIGKTVAGLQEYTPPEPSSFFSFHPFPFFFQLRDLVRTSFPHR